MHICSSGGSRCHEYAISGLTFACLNDATDRTQKWRRELAAYILPPCGGDDKRLDLHLSQTMPSGDRITGSESQPVSPHGNGFRERIRCVYALAQSGRGDLQGEGTCRERGLGQRFTANLLRPACGEKVAGRPDEGKPKTYRPFLRARGIAHPIGIN
ncbi:hypothetical protein SMRU11_25485 [Sinorhizobium meliloti RU11/001]|nr:hypothetical protein SMRU11_25485 [Sinorhizobium meliloti RU11/001]